VMIKTPATTQNILDASSTPKASTTAQSRPSATTQVQTVRTTTAEPSPTTTVLGWELQKAPIALSQFSARMGSKLPAKLKALDAPDGGCVDLATFREGAEAFDPPLTREESDYAFCGMDENHDKRVCSFEFYGTIKIGHFFPSRAHLDQLREVGVLPAHTGKGHRSAQTDAKKGSEEEGEGAESAQPLGTRVPRDELEQYRSVPATVSGRAEITLHVSSAADTPGLKENTDVGNAFKEALEKELGLEVEIVGVESFRVESSGSAKVGNARDRTVMILWDAGYVQDGGSLQMTLRRRSGNVEKRIEEMSAMKQFDWLDRASAWVKFTLSYYGPKASALPMGQQISQDIGHKFGEESENGSPAYVMSS